MMKRRNLIAFVSLICCTALHVEAHAGVEQANEPVVSSGVKKAGKHYIQAVVRPDGRVVDRLADIGPAKLFSPETLPYQGGIPNTPEAWLGRMLDPSRNGLVAKHPELLAEWLDAISEPRFMTALASVVMTPQTYTKTLSKMVDPASSRNWAEFADPQILLRWMAVGMDPGFYQAVFLRMTDAGKLRRWGVFSAQTDKSTFGIDGNKDLATREMELRHGEEWLQLPSRETSNPWLLNTANFRY